MSSFLKKKKWTGVVKKVESWEKTGTFLVIVESPSKCKKIEEYLGSQYNCIASIGHLREIESLKSITFRDNCRRGGVEDGTETRNFGDDEGIERVYDIKFSNIKEKESHIVFMRKVIQQYNKENVILATDDDREGEAIAWHICDIFDLPVETTKRIIFHEITKPALLKSIENPGLIDMKIVNSQKARQILDMIVGFKISPFLWKYIYSSKTNSLSAGRCQTATLRLVYDNQKERDLTTSPEIVYKTTASFFSRNIPFVLDHDFATKDSVIEFLNLSSNFPYKLKIGEPKESIQSPPKPFNTSRLLQTASNVLHLSPKQTMMNCQKLYQEGYITYMRTDSNKYSKDFISKVNNFIVDKWGTKYIGPLESLENRDNLNPHEAIRITNLGCSTLPDTMASELNSMYKLIWKNTVESCMSEAKYKVLNASINAPCLHSYIYEIRIPVFLGWKIIKDNKVLEEQEDGTSIFLYFESLSTPSSSSEFRGSETPPCLTYNKIDSIAHFKNKHSYYTEASLIKKLEELGIGRPSTFSHLVETIQDRGYIKRKSVEGELYDCIDFTLKNKVLNNTIIKKKWGNESNKLVIEPIGILAIEFLIKYFNELFSYEYTKKMEEELDELINNPFQICSNCSTIIEELTKKMKKVEKQKYIVGDYELVFQSFGPVLKKKGENNTFEYKSIKKGLNIDLEKLQNNQYTLDDLLEIKNEILGTYENETVFLRTGQYGPYIEWGDIKKSIKNLPLENICLSDVLPFLKEEEEGEDMKRKPPASNSNILRIVDDNTSIRKGKFGPYIYYKTPAMTSPKFFPLKGMKQYNTIELPELQKWIKEKHKITM